MNKADRMEPAYLSSLFGPESSWGPDYDVAERMAELENFWAAGVTAALYDALKHQEWNPHIEPPKWILDASIKVVEHRLRAGFETKQKLGKRNDERKIYQSEIASYYRWREVWKSYLAGDTLETACAKASAALAGTDYEGEEETMRKAYQKISKELKDPAKAFRYYSAMPKTREITGTSIVRKIAKKT